MAVLSDARRFDVRMSPELAQQLDDVATLKGMTRADVFRRAVALYKRAAEAEIKEGGRVLIEDKEGNVRELVGL